MSDATDRSHEPDVPDISSVAAYWKIESPEDRLLFECKLEIEQAWMRGAGRATVHRLAAAHPELADELYEFFAFMVDAHEGLSWEGDAPEEPGGNEARPFLAILRDATGESVEAIAASMEVTADFLVDLSDHGTVLPLKARAELVRRAAGMLDVGETEAVASFDVASVRRAASRDRAYPTTEVTFRELVERSGLSEEQKRYWAGFG